MTATITRLTALLGSVCLGLLAGADEAAAQEEWPSRPLTMVVGFDVGGSADTTARAVSRFLPEKIGAPVVVVNKPGAGSQLAASYVLARPDDCNTLFFSSITPYLATSILVGNAQYKLDDFAFINGQWTDWDIIAANKDTPYETLPDLLNAIKENPGDVTVSLVFGSSGHLSTLLLLDALGIPHDNLNLVNYDSGGGARTAVAGGQVDFTNLGGEGSEGIRDFITPLAVVREEPHPEWDAPPVNEALEPLGVEIPLVLGSMRGMAVSAACKEAHPERYQKIVDAYKAVLQDEEALAFMKKAGIGTDWLGPEKTTAQIMDMYEVFDKYSGFLEN